MQIKNTAEMVSKPNCHYHVPVHIATASRHHHTSAAGNFCHLWIVSNTKSYQAFKAKTKDLDCKAKVKANDKDFGLNDQGQGV